MSTIFIKVKMFVILVFCLSALEGIRGQFQEQFFRKIQKGYRIPTDYIKSNHSVSSILECGHFCLKESCPGFNYKGRKNKKEINCQLTDHAGATVISDDEEWEFYLSAFEYGTEAFLGKSCIDILMRNFPNEINDGSYWISLNSGTSEAFPVFCDMKNGGWTLIFKEVSNVSGIMSKIWKDSATFHEMTLEALNKETNFKNHYKNRIVKEWNVFHPTQARVVLYSAGKEDLALTFNAQGTDNLSWFAEVNLLSSPWQDIHMLTNKNYFNVTGECWSSQCRDFHINHHYGGCEMDTGWLSIGNSGYCSWETRHGETSFLYSKKTTAVNWNDHADVGSSEVFAVYLR